MRERVRPSSVRPLSLRVCRYDGRYGELGECWVEPLIDLVFSAVGTVASGALSGAGGEMGRRISERLHGLLGRAGSEPGTPAGQQVLVLPVTEHERRAAALQLVELAHSSPEFAREVREWVREASRLAPRPVTAVAPGASRPQMLPPATAAFTDREDVLAWIKDLLDDADRAPGAPVVATLTGPGGIGKTATVVRCAHELRERFPDGVLFVDLAGASAGTALTPSEALVRLLEGLKVGTVPGDEARQRDLFRDCTADRRMIVVLDNALDDAQVLPLLPASPGSLVLVSSRHRLGRLVAEHGAHPFTLRPLSTADSVLLLRRVAGRNRSAAPEEVVRAVAEGTGGIPLAVCTTGAGLAVREHLSWDRVARGLSDRIHGTRQTGALMGDTDPHAPRRPRPARPGRVVRRTRPRVRRVLPRAGGLVLADRERPVRRARGRRRGGPGTGHAGAIGPGPSAGGGRGGALPLPRPGPRARPRAGGRRGRGPPDARGGPPGGDRVSAVRGGRGPAGDPAPLAPRPRLRPAHRAGAPRTGRQRTGVAGAARRAGEPRGRHPRGRAPRLRRSRVAAVRGDVEPASAARLPRPVDRDASARGRGRPARRRGVRRPARGGPHAGPTGLRLYGSRRRRKGGGGPGSGDHRRRGMRTSPWPGDRPGSPRAAPPQAVAP
ncbi:hypothetical protein GPN2_13181 [Streptomyces murinus]